MYEIISLRNFKHLSDQNQIACETVETLDCIHGGVILSGNFPECVTCLHNVSFVSGSDLPDALISFIQSRPCERTDKTVLLKTHKLLESEDRSPCFAAEDAVLSGCRNTWIIFGDHI